MHSALSWAPGLHGCSRPAAHRLDSPVGETGEDSVISAIEKLSERTEEARAEEVQRKWGLSQV